VGGGGPECGCDAAQTGAGRLPALLLVGLLLPAMIRRRRAA